MKKIGKTGVRGEHGRALPGSRAELGSRIEAVADALGLRKDAARIADISPDQLARYISGEGEISFTPVARMAAAAGFSLDWVWHGGPNPKAAPSNLVEQNKPDYAYIPLYDVRAAAGHGKVVDAEPVIDVLAFRSEWLRQELQAQPGDVRLIFVAGDSMEPDLHGGDIVMIDIRDTGASADGFYVMRMNGTLLVKQLQRLPGGVIEVSSRNSAYKSYTIDPEKEESSNGFAIIGRVVWACRRF